MLCDTLNLGSGHNSTAGGEHAVDRTKLLAGTLRVGTHAALAHDHTDTGQLGELILELLHTHGGGGADGDHLVSVLFAGNGTNDGAGMEDCLILDVIGQVTTVLHQTAVSHVTAGHQIAVQINDIADGDVGNVLCGHRSDEDLLTISNFYHYSSTPE